ncbi:nascent polypeptide-associated complex protein [Candidatus Woesearchaeota archaeon]|nr:nascent polypeptide-associated complex protein [Candidatus Woesearchaeota archaeon]
MMPGMNPRQMRQAMQRMGIKQEEVPAIAVEITCPDKKIIIEDPQVMKVNMMGQESLQITGTLREESLNTTPTISEDDISTVMDQTGCTKEEAMQAIQDKNGDLAEAILKLTGNE